MDKDFKSWFLNRKIDPNSFNTPFGFDHIYNIPSLGNMSSPNVTFEATKLEEHSGWSHGLSCYHRGEGLTPVVNTIWKTQLPEFHAPQPAPNEVQKKFLVFDQSNDRTTMIYTAPPIQCQLLKKEISVIQKHEDTRCSNLFLADEINEASEMREDTEDLNALLYSDDDDDDDVDDDDEQSTGHSPDLMMGNDGHDAEEVASSTGCWKRHKLDTGGYDIISPGDTASSGKFGVNCSGETEGSVCRGNSGAANGVSSVESEIFPAGKPEKVRETINILKNLIPGGKRSRDPMMILDEAIDYLRILKVKAKALGLESL